MRERGPLCALFPVRWAHMTATARVWRASAASVPGGVVRRLVEQDGMRAEMSYAAIGESVRIGSGAQS